MKELQESLKTSGSKVIYFEDDNITKVRLLPVKGQKTPFNVAFVHYPSNKVVPKTVFSPKSWDENEHDVLEEYCNNELNKGHKEEAEFVFLIKLKPQPVVIAPAIVRGEESKGVQLLSLNKSQFDSIMKVCSRAFTGSEDVTIWDIDEGFDILVDVESGEPYRSIEFDIDRKPSPLKSKGIEDETILDWLENQPSWEEAYKKATNEELGRYLKNYLQDVDDEGDDLEEYAEEEEEYDLEDDIDTDEQDDTVKNALDNFRKSVKNQDPSENKEEAVVEENPFAKKG